jgi:RNA polymerase sigma factor (sigma-70 family)
MATYIANLITSNTKQLHTLAFYLTKNRNDADDLYQETVMKMLKNESRFLQGTNFKAWSNTIMRNTFINKHRGGNKVTYYVDATDMQNGMYDTRQAINEGETNIGYENLITVINTLDERKRNIFMTFTKGYSYEEMTNMFNINIPNLRSIVFAARQELRYKLTKMNVAV